MTEFDPFDAPTSDTTHSAAPVSLGNEVTGDDLFEGGTPLATTQTLPSATESFSTSTSVAAAPAPSLGHDMASSSSFEQPHDDALVYVFDFALDNTRLLVSRMSSSSSSFPLCALKLCWCLSTSRQVQACLPTIGDRLRSPRLLSSRSFVHAQV
jgi:hypothetical protein